MKDQLNNTIVCCLAAFSVGQLALVLVRKVTTRPERRQCSKQQGVSVRRPPFELGVACSPRSQSHVPSLSTLRARRGAVQQDAASRLPPPLQLQCSSCRTYPTSAVCGQRNTAVFDTETRKSQSSQTHAVIKHYLLCD